MIDSVTLAAVAAASFIAGAGLALSLILTVCLIRAVRTGLRSRAMDKGLRDLIARETDR